MSGLALLLWLGAASGGTWELADGRRAREALVVAAPSARHGYGEVVRALAAAAPSGELPPDLDARARAIGFTLVREGDVAWLVEAGAPAGAGLVGVRLGPLDGELVLQAPHPYYDLGTGRLTGALFDAGGVRAVCIATAHRDLFDVAHATSSHFQSATDALVSVLPDALVVQIHGYGAGTSAADAVWSRGITPAAPASLALEAAALGLALGVSDVRLGEEVSALAGRANVQGRLISGVARFRHLELSRAVRLALDDDEALRRALLASLVDLGRAEDR